MDWKDINAIRAEWPKDQLDAASDRMGWLEADRLYDNDDYRSMMRCANLYAAALAHELYGDSIIPDDELMTTVFRTLFCCLSPPPDRQTFNVTAQRPARIALTLMRENGWGPSSMGGSGPFDQIVMDRGNQMLLSTAIGPPEAEWKGDLRAFFAVPPEPRAFDAPPEPSTSALNDVSAEVQRADSGDEGAALYLQGLRMAEAGDLQGALQVLSEAARHGSVQAMKEAGDVARDLRLEGEASFWFDSAAAAGHPIAMFNKGYEAHQSGDLDATRTWMQRAAEAGNTEAYAVLTSMALEAGDGAAERHWAKLGAQAGHTWCLMRHGTHLLVDANGSSSKLREALAVLDVAAARGDAVAMMQAGTACTQIGDRAAATQYYARARASGDPQVLQMLDKYGV